MQAGGLSLSEESSSTRIAPSANKQVKSRHCPQIGFLFLLHETSPPSLDITPPSSPPNVPEPQASITKSASEI